MTQPTIKDVAKLAGVSISTVSRVMNNSKPVSKEARKKVEDAIEKLDFKPNELARSLVMKKSNSIGISVEDIGIEYMAEIIRGIEEIGRMYNFNILLTSTYGDVNNAKENIDFLYRKQVEGIIILSEDLDHEVLSKIMEYKIPYIQLDRYYKANDYNTVTINFFESMKKMVQYLLDLGHSNIAYISKNSKYEIDEFKLNGYRTIMGNNSLKELVYTGDTNNEYFVKETMEDIINNHKDITAIVCSDDLSATEIINYCYDNDISVPDDYSVTGFGDSKLAHLYRPRITTVVEPYYDIGAVAMRMIIKYLNDENEELNETVYLSTEIRERESTKKIK